MFHHTYQSLLSSSPLNSIQQNLDEWPSETHTTRSGDWPYTALPCLRRRCTHPIPSSRLLGLSRTKEAVDPCIKSEPPSVIQQRTGRYRRYQPLYPGTTRCWRTSGRKADRTAKSEVARVSRHREGARYETTSFKPAGPASGGTSCRGQSQSHGKLEVRR